MLETQQMAIDFVSRMITHNDMIGNPLQTNENKCVVPVANFNFSEIILYEVEVIEGQVKILKKEVLAEKEEIDKIVIKSFK